MPDKSIGLTKLEQIIKEMDRVAVFIDGHATQGATKSIDMKIDWKKFQGVFMHLARVKKIGYYIAVPEDVNENGVEERDDSTASTTTNKPWWRGVTDWMGYNNYRVVIRQGHEFKYTDGKSKSGVGIKTSVDIVLAVEAMALAGDIDHAVLFTGNGDFTSLVNALQNKNVVVTIISNSYSKLNQLGKIPQNRESYPFIASKGLIRAANNFIDLEDLRDDLHSEDRL